jgi:hypothetical protein
MRSRDDWLVRSNPPSLGVTGHRNVTAASRKKQALATNRHYTTEDLNKRSALSQHVPSRRYVPAHLHVYHTITLRKRKRLPARLCSRRKRSDKQALQSCKSCHEQA